MPYYPRFNLLQLHVPKTGGTSLENALQSIQRSELFDYPTSKERHARGDRRWQHNNLYGYELIEGQEFALQHLLYKQMIDWKLLPRQGTAPLILITVRNPFTRMVSEYKWQLLFGYDKSFRDFVVEAHANEWFKSRAYHQHLLPQVEFLRGVDLNNPLLHLVYFEHLQQAMQHFFEHMSQTYPEFANVILPRDNDTTNVSAGSHVEKESKRPWREFYSDQPDDLVQRLVRTMYAEDFATFGYELDIDAT